MSRNPQTQIQIPTMSPSSLVVVVVTDIKGHHRLSRKSRVQLLLITSPQKKLVPLV
ncbi:putative serine/threonine protein kinase with a predicted role in sphingolipid-mediated signaling pathway that controls endocytosis [Candida albicans P60002]|nr:hypothetical protein MEO_01206 [Candida albicans P94015]KGR02963.1 hypothetical protein MG1_01209 [Candida albicans GC75]KGU13474.1 hypothetical protein MEQ_01194 [Candida albicans P87]KGU16804.1 hypothetical protein MEY_01207 [Candida albicans 19F]KGU34596.1 putative serine/threonine protein kinase with a predicted role in sphingolipid-mediated signaling pathway that controls endocytosis [Candida albicans P75063]KHC41237.1 putative serine/threonine protein kinase with a predicted role in s